ncbi:MAG: hypothetical protein VR72_07565 [Clostridiaceae bacterium BRH_c20a]|nr:MAG: hypothetical protein VR72_07565 [Clostridiaceae bacterium BRH_c20a]
MGFFSSLFGKKEPKKARIIDDLQIEIAHRSPLENKTNQFMELSTFFEASKYFNQAKRVHFLGWEDPLEHPQFFEMFKIARENSSQLEITTLGTKLNPSNIKELTNLSPDKITINFNYPIVTLNNVSENIMGLVKQRKNDTKIILDFVMTQDSISDLPSFVEQAGDLGIDEINASNINFIISPETNSKKAFEGIISDENRGDLIKQGKAKGKEEYEAFINQAKKIADRKNVYFNPKPLIGNEAITCDYNPLKNVFVTWDGLITPCPYLALKNVRAFFNEKEFEQPSFIIGNINETNFLDLWSDKRYLDFRGVYDRRIKLFNTYMDETFDNEPTSQLIHINYQKLDQQLAEEKVPVVCANCYKVYGI